MNYSKLLIIGLGCLLATSCVSIDTIEPNDTTDSSDRIVISLNTPEIAKTRADNGYKLRYIAKIFSGSTSNTWGNPLDRQEIIDGDEADNQIVFKVTPDYDYAIMVFADYIPENYKKGSNGQYQDYFYNTTRSKQVVLRTTPGSDDTSVSADFFNNDNYDCFYEMVTFHKSALEKVIDLTLTRATGKVIFREKTDKKGECAINVNKVNPRMNFYFDNKLSSDPTGGNTKAGNIPLNNQPEITDYNKDLFYFYTLADSLTSPQYVLTTFTVNPDNADASPITINNIPVKRNYRTIVKGEFLSDSHGNTGSGDGNKEGDIILNLSTDYTWEEEIIEN